MPQYTKTVWAQHYTDEEGARGVVNHEAREQDVHSTEPLPKKLKSTSFCAGSAAQVTAQVIADQSLDGSEALNSVSGMELVVKQVIHILQKGLGHLYSSVEAVTPLDEIPLAPHPMVAQFDTNCSVVVSPAALGSWERARLQPIGGQRLREVVAYVLCPEQSLVEQATGAFLGELGSVFDCLSLGKHIFSEANVITFKSSDDCEINDAEWGKAAQTTAFKLSVACSNNKEPILYVVTGGAHQVSLQMLSVMCQKCLEVGCAETAVQLIPLGHVLSLVHPIEVLKDMAMSVYMKLCRSPPMLTPLVPLNGAGAGWCVERTLGRGLVAMLHPDSEPFAIHCCYRYLPEEQCLICVWVDCQGVNLRTMVISGNCCEQLIAKCWKVRVEIAPTSKDHATLRVVVTCLGIPTEVEIEHWKQLASESGTSEHLVLLSLDTTEACILGLKPDCATFMWHPLGALSDKTTHKRLSGFVSLTDAIGNILGYKAALLHPEKDGPESQQTILALLKETIKQFNALSWMTASPLHLARRSPLPIHSAMVQRMMAWITSKQVLTF